MVIDDRTWILTRTLDEVRAVFPAGTRVRHANPELADWRGTVVPLAKGPNAGRCLAIDEGGRVDVRVRWDRTRECPSSVGWTGQGALIPL